MIHNLKPYPAYKDSGVSWLGEVPEHWQIRRLKHTSTLHGRIGFHGLSSSDYGSDGIIVVSGSNFRDWHVDWGQCNRISEDWYEKDKNIQLRNGDLLVTKDGTIGKTAIVKELTEKAVLNSGVIVVRSKMPIQYENRYLLYLINSKVFDAFIDIKKTGATIHHLYEATFNNFSISLPPLSEQSAIVHYLDHFDRRIRRYILAKKKLIKLLEERKQAIIHQAVTRGLDASVKLKPSGIEWLGEVPEHWEACRIKSLFREKDERSGNGSGVLLSLTRARGIIPQAEASNRIASVEDLSKYKVCLPGDLIMNRMQAWSGMFAVSSYKGLVSPDYSVFTTIRSLEVKYFENLFKTPVLVDQFAQRSKGIGSGFNRLYTPDFGAVPIVIPPFPEQSAIVRFLDNVNSDLRQAIETAHHEISLLHEYRTRLIADVVTGKLDVREAASNLPEEAGETETLDDSLSEDEELENNEIENEQAGELEDEVLA